MKRFTPVLGIILLVMLVGAAIWTILEAVKCTEEGGIVIAPLTRGAFCELPGDRTSSNGHFKHESASLTSMRQTWTR